VSPFFDSRFISVLVVIYAQIPLVPFVTLPPGGVRSTVMSVFVCLFVRLFVFSFA